MHEDSERGEKISRNWLGTIADLHGMNAEIWERHANPWSGLTRLPILPLLTAAIYWRDTLGWLTWPIVAALLVWTWLNPRMFPPPRSTDNWMSKAVMGERIWLARHEIEVPLHYRRAIPIIFGFSLPGLPLIAMGLFHEEGWPVLLGLVLCLIGKFWFLDRMVWLYDDMSRTHTIYRAWLR
ncbi:MAG: DUF6653 family protein [Pseudomonadota bacterium]